MNSSSATYLAADILTSNDSEEISEEEKRRNELLQQSKQVEQNTLDPSKRCLSMLIESEKIAIKTAQYLSRQREKIMNTENRLDETNSTLKDTQKNINGNINVFSGLKQWWTIPKQPPADGKNSKSNPFSSSSSMVSEQTQPALTKNLSSVENSQMSMQFSQGSHTAILGTSPGFSSDLKLHSQNVNKQLDNDLECMSSGHSRLNDLAQGVGTEIEKQNSSIDRIEVKMDKATASMISLNTRMNRLLKK